MLGHQWWAHLAAWLALAVLVAGCSPSLSGTYVDASDASRYYTFKWNGKWVDETDHAGTYQIQGTSISMQGWTALTGDIVSADEIRLYDVPSFVSDREFTTYRHRD